ncbi:MAG: hypothetical protein ACOYJD_06850 [Christensenellales bacterium]
MSKIIMGLKLEQRVDTAPKVQELLSKYGCSISTRVGFHMASENVCSPHGLIVLEFIEDADKEAAALEKELVELGCAEVQKMVF